MSGPSQWKEPSQGGGGGKCPCSGKMEVNIVAHEVAWTTSVAKLRLGGVGCDEVRLLASEEAEEFDSWRVGM